MNRSERNVYLTMKTLEEARAILFQAFPVFSNMPGESVSVPDAVGRILAEPVTAKLSSPNFHAAAMDGIAVNAESTFGANETRPKELEIGKDAFYVNTGHVLPQHTNAVIMIEQVQVLDDRRVQIEAPAFPWQHVRKMGEDIVATELLFPRNHKVTPYCVGALLSAGIFSVKVRKPPRLFIIPTGSEMTDWRTVDIQSLQPGQILETNSEVLGKLTESSGGTWVRHEIVKDNIPLLRQTIETAVQEAFDMILILGGSSAGSEDFARTVIAELGTVLVHGVTMMPGKPLIIGKIQDKPIFGIPGYPVSAIVAFEQFVQPLICHMLGQPEIERQQIIVEPSRKIPSKLGVEEFIRVKLGKVGNRIVATPLPRMAGCITTLTKANAMIRIPNPVEGLKEYQPVTAELLKPIASLDRTIVVVGSHDNTLDVLADELRAEHNGLTLSSSHVGSMGGLMAIKRGVCHIAGSHLLDTEDGTYNISYIRRYLPHTKVKLVHLVFRDQGLIVLPGNPKQIKGIEDLSREDVTFINRQGGSGTRVLLDFRLKQLGMDPSNIKGYLNEEVTHMAVAVAVLSGAADAGLGIYAAAKALNLDFLPVVTEQYDLVIPEEFFESEHIRILLQTIQTEDFKARVQKLGGYHTEMTGKILM